MGYYDALIAKWGTLAPDTTENKLAALNAETIAGPNSDVQVSSVIGKLMLARAYLPLEAFAAGLVNGDATHDMALMAAKMLAAMIGTPNAPVFQMSDPTAHAAIKGMMDAILAQEMAALGSTGFTQSVHDALLSLCATQIPWWQGNGYQRAFDLGDVTAAGLS